jgi:hypothetical protein
MEGPQYALVGSILTPRSSKTGRPERVRAARRASVRVRLQRRVPNQAV